MKRKINIEINPRLLKEAIRVAGTNTVSETVEKALRTLIRANTPRRKKGSLADFFRNSPRNSEIHVYLEDLRRRQ